MAYTGTKLTITSATCTLGGVNLGLGGMITANINYGLETEEVSVWGNYPNPIVIGTKLKTSGSLEYYVTKGVLPALPTGTAVALVIVLPLAFSHTQNVMVTSVDFSPSADNNIEKCTVSWEGAGAYTVVVPE